MRDHASNHHYLKNYGRQESLSAIFLQHNIVSYELIEACDFPGECLRIVSPVLKKRVPQERENSLDL